MFLELENGLGHIFYETFGDPSAPAVTLVNGFSRTSSDFSAMASYLEQQGFFVVTLDNRGAGKTETPLGFSLSNLVKDIVRLWDQLGTNTSHLLGVSYGGVLALNVAHEYSDRVRKLVLVSTTSNSQFIHLEGQLYEQNASEIDANLARYFSAGFATSKPILFKGLVKEAAKTFNDPQGRLRTKAQREALRNFDFTPWLPKISQSTLVLHGTEDRIIDPRSAEIFGAHIPGSRVELFPGVGHLLLAESPKRFYVTVARFLKE